MAEIKGFRGLRFQAKAGEIGALCCPPYDIISEPERQAFLQANSHNIIRLELPREGDDPYAQAGRVYQSWLDDGILAQDETESLYIYEEEFAVNGRTAKIQGFTCAVKLTPFSQGVVLPHEETLPKAKEDRLNLMKACGCNFSPVYSLYADEDRAVAGILQEQSSRSPDVAFTSADGVTHRLWTVTDPACIAAIQAAFADKKIYIADGHHRYETALTYRDFLEAQGVDASSKAGADFVMMTLVDITHPGLVVFPTHRVVRDLPDFDPQKVLSGCGPYFTAEPIPNTPQSMAAALDTPYAAGHKSFVFAWEDAAYLLTLKDARIMEEVLTGCSSAYQSLDVNILHKLVLERLLGIDKANLAAQKNVYYTRDIDEALGAVQARQANCAFLLNPTRVEELAQVAAAGEKMPQKSTYFYPKLITGLVMSPLTFLFTRKEK